jgi:hypothetical protein
MTPQRKTISFEIVGRVIKYFDDNWKSGIQIMPLDRLMVKKMIASRKSTIKAMGLLIADTNLNKKSIKEYQSCKTEGDLAEMIRKDSLLKGLRETK